LEPVIGPFISKELTGLKVCYIDAAVDERDQKFLPPVR
jgi:hypothetical protein